LGLIRVLDVHLSNQIAAGEVVERPSSVVKELVENAIDAGSSRIEVMVEEGGLQLIRITDNGAGMDAEDCQLAFSRHATSKIATSKDLFQIRTLGFRGEALPSIAAVAKISCTTSREESGLGTRLRMEGGEVTALEETAAPRGTDIVVKDLFYNTPARLKYMKTVQTEMSHISDYLYRLALSYPNIAFSLRHNSNLLLQTAGKGDLLQVIASIYGNASAKQMLKLEAENPDYRLSGWVSKPELNRSNRQAMTLIVNGRYVRSFGLSQAITEAYHTLLPIHRYPLAVVHLQMEPTLLDVNVHPAKLEVRFSKEQELYQFVQTAIKHHLRQQTLIPEPQRATVKEQVVQERLALYGQHGQAAAAREQTIAADESASFEGARGAASVRSFEPDIKPGSTGAAPIQPSMDNKEWRRPVNASSAPRFTPAAAPENVMSWIEPPAESPPAAPVFPELNPIGQVHGTYIVAQNETGLYLIDQHAAHERINYEKYYDLFGNPADASQELIVPITLEFTTAETEILKDKLPIFEQAGVVLEHFGGHSFIVRAYPYWLPKGEEERIIRDMADWILSEKQTIDIAKLREQSAILCSCKASIKANDRMSMQEMEGLIARLSNCRSPFTCPHGRPITVSFTTYELEKMFKRVM
jgi:DNA mismatch repair protein MutL